MIPQDRERWKRAAGDGQRAADAGTGRRHARWKSATSHRRAHLELAVAEASSHASERAGHRDHPRAAHPRHHRHAPRRCAAPGGGAHRWRRSGGFTPEATSPHTAREYVRAGGIGDGTYSVYDIRRP